MGAEYGRYLWDRYGEIYGLRLFFLPCRKSEKNNVSPTRPEHLSFPQRGHSQPPWAMQVASIDRVTSRQLECVLCDCVSGSRQQKTSKTGLLYGRFYGNCHRPVLEHGSNQDMINQIFIFESSGHRPDLIFSLSQLGDIRLPDRAGRPGNYVSMEVSCTESGFCFPSTGNRWYPTIWPTTASRTKSWM